MSAKLNYDWLEFYQIIKGADWPNCQTEEDIINLPEHILKNIIFNFLKVNDNISERKFKVCKMSNLKTKQIENLQFYQKNPQLDISAELLINDIKIFYESSLDGGGTSFGRRYPYIIKEIYRDRIFENCFEWCAGPGFTGFELLSENICNNLFLADIYQPALTAINKTVTNLPAKYQNKVHSAQIKGIADLPAEWKFDLVVANPPMYNSSAGAFITSITPNDRIYIDQDWNLHREFFNHIVPHLNDNAVILILEHAFASGPDMFNSMIREAGLRIKDCYYENARSKDSYLSQFLDFYFIEIVKQ